MALPRHLSADRLIRVALTACQNTPLLFECTTKSLLGSIMQCAQLGLEPDGILGHAYLIPYRNRKKGDVQECQLMVGYKGLVDLARRSGQVETIMAQAVYGKDRFDYEYGLEPKLTHKPSDDADRGKMTHVYAVAHLKGGGRHFEVLSISEVDKIKNASAAVRSGRGTPWDTHYEAMARKTAIRRLAKYLPLSPEFQRAAELDEHAELGLDQGLSNALLPGDADGAESIPEIAMPKRKSENGKSDRTKKLFFAAGKTGWDEESVTSYLRTFHGSDDISGLEEDSYAKALAWVSAHSPSEPVAEEVSDE